MPIKKMIKYDLIAVQPDNYTNSQIKKIKKNGCKVLAYLSIGTISDQREWYKKYKKYKLKRLADWPHQFYMDMRSPVWMAFLLKRAKYLLKQRHFDGLWLDNLDVYQEYKGPAMYDACTSILKQIKKLGGYIMVNGGSQFWDVSIDKKRRINDMVDGVTQEEVFSLIKNYSKKGKFGKQTSAQSKFYQSLMKKLLNKKVQTFLLEYTTNLSLKQKIKTFCKKQKITGYYISNNVNL